VPLRRHRDPARLRARRPLAGAAVLGLAAALALAGCGSEERTGGSGPLSGTTVSGGSETAPPKVTLDPKPLTVEETTTKVVTPGEGEPVSGDEIVSLRFVLLNGKDGRTVDSNYGRPTLGLNLADTELLPGLRKGLTDQRVGSRVLIAIPPKDAFGERGNPDIEVGAGDTIVFVMDLLSAELPLTSAEGTPVRPAPGLPTAAVEEGKPATITIPKGAKPPTATVAQVLVQGRGAKVAAGQTIRVAYTGALWRNGEVFDSSANSPQGYFETVIGQKQVIAAWDAKLVGQNVGTRLLLVVPPADGYGAAGAPPKISGTDTLVFVIDILAAY
jgi:peptidylprolyl isomerase